MEGWRESQGLATWSGPGSSDGLGFAALAVFLVDLSRGPGLELGGREVAEGRVSAGRVVGGLDELEDAILVAIPDRGTRPGPATKRRRS